MEAFLATGGFDFPVMLDQDNMVARAYGISAIPTIFVIDAEGFVVDGFVGGVTAAQLASLVDGLVD